MVQDEYVFDRVYTVEGSLVSNSLRTLSKRGSLTMRSRNLDIEQANSCKYELKHEEQKLDVIIEKHNLSYRASDNV